MPGLWSRDLALLLLTNIILYSSFHFLTPTLPLFVTHLGGGTAAAGLAMGLFTAAAVLVRPFSGWALEAYGRRVLLLLGLGTFILGSLGYSWLSAVALLIVLRFFHGACFGVFTVSSGTLAADLTPKERLGEGMGFLGVSWSLSAAIGPVLGLAILDRGGFNAMFAAAAGLGALALLTALPLRYPRLEHRRPPFSLGGLFHRACLFPGVLTFLLTTSYGLVISFVSLYALDREMEHVGLFFTVYAVVLTVSRLLTGRIADRLGFALVVSLGLVIVAASQVTLGLSSGLVGFLAAATLFALGFGALQPALLALMVDSVPASRRGTANAAFLSAYDLGISAGAIGGGLVARVVSLGELYVLGALPPLVALVVLLIRTQGEHATIEG